MEIIIGAITHNYSMLWHCLLLLGNVRDHTSKEAAAMPQAFPFDAVVTVVGDHMVAASQVSPPDIDSDYTFFNEIMKFSDEDKEKVAGDALEFFSTTHGLDFSQPDKKGQCRYQNATMYPFRPPLDIFANFSHWKENIGTESKWFRIHIGGYVVSFRGEQKLHGRHGGREGKPVTSGDLLSYQFFNIPIDGQEPVVFRIQTFFPVRHEPVDQHTISNM